MNVGKAGTEGVSGFCKEDDAFPHSSLTNATKPNSIILFDPNPKPTNINAVLLFKPNDVNHYTSYLWASIPRHFVDDEFYTEQQVQTYVFNEWHLRNQVQVRRHGRVFLFKFQDSDDMDLVMAEAPLNMLGALYENVFGACYKCGCIGHNNTTCNITEPQIRLNYRNRLENTLFNASLQLHYSDDLPLYTPQIRALANTHENRNTIIVAPIWMTEEMPQHSNSSSSHPYSPHSIGDIENTPTYHYMASVEGEHSRTDDSRTQSTNSP
ncbi:hypothetical protein LIER_30768 [Lithospermum erythrorhizon]|uniref:CCHC-type domain-containing protein n=1 Tax=Lithospermum erythrorhizon TaxID=34254 RepID=A0AAV3RSG8_LITER